MGPREPLWIVVCRKHCRLQGQPQKDRWIAPVLGSGLYRPKAAFVITGAFSYLVIAFHITVRKQVAQMP